MNTGAGGTKMRRWVLVGLAAAVPLAAVALYFALVAPAPTPSAAGLAAAVTPTLPPNHPPVEGAATPGDRPHPPPGSTGRTVRVPDSVKGKWQAVRLKIEVKSGVGAPQIVTVKLGGDLAIPGSALTLHVDDFLPALQVKDNEITSASNEPSNPAALVTIRDGDTEAFRGWLFGKFPDMQPFVHRTYRITLVEGIPKG